MKHSAVWHNLYEAIQCLWRPCRSTKGSPPNLKPSKLQCSDVSTFCFSNINFMLVDWTAKYGTALHCSEILIDGLFYTIFLVNTNLWLTTTTKVKSVFACVNTIHSCTWICVMCCASVYIDAHLWMCCGKSCSVPTDEVLQHVCWLRQTLL